MTPATASRRMAKENRQQIPNVQRPRRRANGAEMMGRIAAMSRTTLYPPMVTVDRTQPDYAYWDKLARGKMATARIGGLFVKPILSHLQSWTLGKGFAATTEHAKTDEALADFVEKHKLTFLGALWTMLKAGDAYVVVNADGTLTPVPPNQVEKITDDLDYRRVVAYKITTKLEKATILDEYRADGRTVTVTRLTEAGPVTTVSEFRNLTGRIPVIHFANEREENEVFGHSTFEALLSLLFEYDDVERKQLAGVKTLSTPIPVIEDVKDIAKTKAQLIADAGGGSGDVEYRADGESDGMELDLTDMLILDGKFNLKGPNPFTEDTWRVLKNLFLLMLQHTNIPEWVWGGAIASSKASVDAQMPAFAKFIEALQEAFGAPLRELCETWLAVVSVFMPRVKALPVKVTYPPVTEANVTEIRASAKQAADYGLIRDVTHLRLLGLPIDDPEEEVRLAREESDEKRSAADVFDNQMNQLAQGDPDAANEDEELGAVA